MRLKDFTKLATYFLQIPSEAAAPLMRLRVDAFFAGFTHLSIHGIGVPFVRPIRSATSSEAHPLRCRPMLTGPCLHGLVQNLVHPRSQVGSGTNTLWRILPCNGVAEGNVNPALPAKQSLLHTSLILSRCFDVFSVVGVPAQQLAHFHSVARIPLVTQTDRLDLQAVPPLAILSV